MNDAFQKTYEQASAFQKLWMDSFTRMTQVGFTPSPDSDPMDSLRQMRAGIFQALSQSWEEYMRSPHFKESMKMMLDNAIALRKGNNDFFTQAHHSVQGTAREDIDDLLVAIRQAEDRVLNRLEGMAQRLERLEGQMNGTVRKGGAKGSRRAASRKTKAAAKKPDTSTTGTTDTSAS